MAKRKTSAPNTAAEPQAEYTRKAARPAWRFKRLSQQELMIQARKPMTMPSLRRRVEENPFAEPAYAGLLQTSVPGLRAMLRTSRTLVPAQTELLLLYEQTMARGAEVFGDEARYERWLSSPIRALEGQRPADLMTTFTGVRLVADELETIAHGVFA
jgi:hypothetical protein